MLSTLQQVSCWCRDHIMYQDRLPKLWPPQTTWSDSEVQDVAEAAVGALQWSALISILESASLARSKQLWKVSCNIITRHWGPPTVAPKADTQSRIFLIENMTLSVSYWANYCQDEPKLVCRNETGVGSNHILYFNCVNLVKWCGIIQSHDRAISVLSSYSLGKSLAAYLKLKQWLDTGKKPETAPFFTHF